MITDPSWRWRRQKKLPDLTFAFVDSRGIVGQRQVLLFSMFSMFSNWNFPQKGLCEGLDELLRASEGPQERPAG